MSFLARLFGRPARPRGRHAGARGGAPARPAPSAVPSVMAQPAVRVTMPSPGPSGPSGSVVALIYRDGTSLAFPAGDPRARAYRTLADHLAARG